MHTGTRVLAVVLIVFLAALGYVAVTIARHGFSARESPSRLEEFLARHARQIAAPAGARQLKNAYPVNPETLRAAREHWVEHCVACHALDGSGNTFIGHNLYPKVPDMRDAATQGLSDGELYYIIRDGVRFTGMPAWGGLHSPEETWQLVSFVRRLPYLSAEELKVMEQQATGEAGGAPVHPHTHGPEAKPHEHHH